MCGCELVPSVNMRSLPRFKNYSDPPVPVEEVKSGVMCVASVVGSVQRRRSSETRRGGLCCAVNDTPTAAEPDRPHVISGVKILSCGPHATKVAGLQPRNAEEGGIPLRPPPGRGTGRALEL